MARVNVAHLRCHAAGSAGLAGFGDAVVRRRDDWRPGRARRDDAAAGACLGGGTVGPRVVRGPTVTDDVASCRVVTLVEGDRDRPRSNQWRRNERRLPGHVLHAGRRRAGLRLCGQRAKRSTVGVVGERFLDPVAARGLAGPRPGAADVPLAGGVCALCHDAGMQPSDAGHRPEWTVAVGCPAAGWRVEERLRHRANRQPPQPSALAADQSSGTTAGPAAAATPQPRQDLARELEPHRVLRYVYCPASSLSCAYFTT